MSSTLGGMKQIEVGTAGAKSEGTGTAFAGRDEIGDSITGSGPVAR